MDMLKAILQCLTAEADNTADQKVAGFPVDDKAGKHVYISEKPKPYPTKHLRTTPEVAAAICSALREAEKPGRDLDTAIKDIVSQAGGFSERIAAAILAALQKALKEGSPMRQAMREAYNKASDAAAGLPGFAREHPIFCTVIALGILVILAPAIIHALGFGLSGPIEGESSLWNGLRDMTNGT